MGSYGKLSRQKFGPFRILKKLRSNAFLLDLPDDVSTSPIFNIPDSSMFKEDPPKATEIATLPYIDAPRAMEDFIEDIVVIKNYQNARWNTSEVSSS